jgi:hypothetical protein
MRYLLLQEDMNWNDDPCGSFIVAKYLLVGNNTQIVEELDREFTAMLESNRCSDKITKFKNWLLHWKDFKEVDFDTWDW